MSQTLKNTLVMLIVGVVLLVFLLPLGGMWRNPGGLPAEWYVVTIGVSGLLLCTLGLLLHVRLRHAGAFLLLVLLAVAYGGILRHQQQSWVKWRERGRQSVSFLAPPPVPEKPPSDMEFVLIAGIPNSAVASAKVALKQAGIDNFSHGSRSTGIEVRKRDAERAKEVLKADARSHHYPIVFGD